MFKDRKDAGEKLAIALNKYRHKHVIVLAIPRGGIETAYYVASYLHAEMALVITRKLAYPSNPEAAFGAIAEDGSLFLSQKARKELSADEIANIIEQQKREIEHRIKTFRQGKSLPKLKGRTVIITDDGIATGATLFATIELCRKKQAGKIVVAAPIAYEQIENILRYMVDEVVILESPPIYHAVSQGYEYFYNLTDEESLSFLTKWEKEYNSHHTSSGT
jgi:putative phosphoribosyl transferase